MLEKIKKWAPVGGLIFILLFAGMLYSMLAPEGEEILLPDPGCNVTLTCPPCPEPPDVYVTVPSADLSVPTYTQAEVEVVVLNYLSNLMDDPRTWFTIQGMTYGSNGNWTVQIQRQIPGSPSSPRNFTVIFNEPTASCL